MLHTLSQVLGHPNALSSFTSLLPQEGCLSTQSSLQAEHRDAKQKCDLGSWTWSRMARGITSLPCQPLA